MKATKIALASLLSASMLLSLAGCKDKGESSKPNGDVSAVMSEEMKQKIEAAAKSLDTSINLENKELKWLCWAESWNYNEDTPEGKLFKEAYGGYVTTETCAYADRYSVLAQKVSSGESPDMFPFESDNYPSGVISGMYEPLDDYMDLNSDAWAYTKDLMDKYIVAGKHYVILPYSKEGDFLVYNRDTMNQYGLDDPWELFMEGKWDWNAMYDMLKTFCNADEDRYGIGGYWPEHSFVATTGKPFVTLSEDGHLVSNLNSTEVAKSMNFLAKLYAEGLHYPWEKFDWNKKINFVTEGKTLFYASYEDELRNTFLNKKKTACVENVFIVPFPKDPDSGDKYYQYLGTDAHMLVAGAPNPKGVAVWQDVRRVAHYNPEVTKQSREDRKANYGYTDELLDALDILQNVDDAHHFTGVYDFARGISAELTTGLDDEEGVIQELERSTYKMGKTWTEVLTQYNKQIQSYIDDANTKIDALK